MKECKKHGLTDHIETSNGKYKYFVCRRCRNDRVMEHRRQLKLKAIEYKGGACVVCGYKDCPGALDFHHVDNDKDYGIASRGLTKSWSKLKIELDKCVLLCSNCHREHHWYKSNKVDEVDC